MKKLLLIILFPMFIVFLMGKIFVNQMPGGTDRASARNVANFIESGFGGFDDRSRVENEGKGKTYYYYPGARNNPSFDFYEITSPQDINLIVKLANDSLIKMPYVNSIRLNFYERQVWIDYGNGSKSRGKEQILKRIVVKRKTS